MGVLPVEGWMLVLGDTVYAVKGCEHPLPCFHAVGKRRGRIKLDPFEPLEPLRWSRCLLGKFTVICPWDDPIALDPIASLESLIDAGWRDPIVEELYSVVGGSLGVTGSLLYGHLFGLTHRDIDLVVYGESASKRALNVILDLWAKGLTEPVGGEEYGVVRREVEVEEWLLLASRNPLFFRYGGRRYTVRLVACKSPVACEEPLSRQPIRASVFIEEPVTPCLTPSVYRGRLADGGRVQVYTLRSSLACMPRGSRLDGVFTLEVHRGYTRLVPDGGVVGIQVLQG